MLPPFDYFEHRRACAFKQKERVARIASLPEYYKGPITSSDKSILSRPIAEIVQDVHKKTISPIDILRTYGKVAVKAHEKTNCVTEVMIPEAEKWAENEVNLQGPLAGIPVSLKDTILVKGFDASVGNSCNVGKPVTTDGIMVKLLKDAGAIPYVKTAVPITLLSFESTNSVWGVAKNPHNPNYSPGGSTGGEGALLALGGRIGVGSDVAGSVRVPAAWSGVYSLRCSTGRWPKGGSATSMPGQEGVPSVFSPMARTLDDLTYFTKSILGMEPWKYDHTVHPIPWRDDAYTNPSTRPLRIGVLSTDDVVDPTPAIARALSLSSSALSAAGHTVVPITPSTFPSTATPLIGLRLASQLLNSDGCATFRSWIRSFEPSDPGAAQLSFYMSLPRPIQYLYYLYVRYIRRDPVWASLLRDFHPQTAASQWKLVFAREQFRAAWHEWWAAPSQSFDYVLCAANASPALPHGAMHHAVSSCGYTFLWNLLDYAAGIVPVTRVDAKLDQPPAAWKPRNGVEKGGWFGYDAAAMHGLPCAVQLVARRLEEEKLLAGMQVLTQALEKQGIVYELLEVE